MKIVGQEERMQTEVTATPMVKPTPQQPRLLKGPAICPNGRNRMGGKMHSQMKPTALPTSLEKTTRLVGQTAVMPTVTGNLIISPQRKGAC